jgi:hypothetical protein
VLETVSQNILPKERRLRMPKHQPAEYKVTVIEGDEPLSEQAVQQVTKILLESKRKREEKNG